MDKKELINEIAKYACNACEMGGDFDGDCHDLIGEYTTCGICQGTANKIYDDFICKYIEELNEKDRQVQHLWVTTKNSLAKNRLFSLSE